MAWSKTKTTVAGVAIALLGIGIIATIVDALLPAPDIQGIWECTVNLGGDGVHRWESPKTRFVLRITETNGGYQTDVNDIDRGINDGAFDTFICKHRSMSGGISKDNISFVGKVNRFGDKMFWKVRAGANAFPVVWTRTSNPPPFPEPLTDDEFAPHAGSTLQGFWVGMIGRGKDALHIRVKIAEISDGMFRADFYVPDQTTNRFPTTVSYDGTTVKLMPMAGYGMFEGWLRNGGQEMVGNWIQNDWRSTTTLTKTNYSEYAGRGAK